MPAIADLTYTNNMAANKQPFLTDLEAAIQSVEDYINAYAKDNLVQLAKDCYPAAYTFDNDGAAQYTMDLYQKTHVTDTYTAGDINIAGLAAWTDVDAANASITYTPELQGDFKNLFQFNIGITSTNAANETLVRFRLTDGTDVSDAIANISAHDIANAEQAIFSINLMHTFINHTAVAKTVKLQYYIDTLTNVTIDVLASVDSPIAMDAQKT